MVTRLCKPQAGQRSEKFRSPRRRKGMFYRIFKAGVPTLDAPALLCQPLIFPSSNFRTSSIRDSLLRYDLEILCTVTPGYRFQLTYEVFKRNG